MVHHLCRLTGKQLHVACFSDDITTTSDGTDTYHLVKAAGRYRLVVVCLSVCSCLVCVFVCLPCYLVSAYYVNNIFDKFTSHSALHKHVLKIDKQNDL